MMTQDNSTAGGPDSDLLRMKRRTFVTGSVAVGGVVAAFGLLEGCSDEVPEASETATVVRLRINGDPREVRVENRTSLLDLLREQVGLTGTKKGCDQGACGACTVMVNDQRVVSCLTLAVQADGAQITTIEGLEQGGRLHPLQQAFIDEDGFQCGYCTAGQIISGIGCIREGHAGSPEEIRESMSGNICRCGAYTNIVTAISRVAQHGGA